MEPSPGPSHPFRRDRDPLSLQDAYLSRVRREHRPQRHRRERARVCRSTRAYGSPLSVAVGDAVCRLHHPQQHSQIPLLTTTHLPITPSTFYPYITVYQNISPHYGKLFISAYSTHMQILQCLYQIYV